MFLNNKHILGWNNVRAWNYKGINSLFENIFQQQNGLNGEIFSIIAIPYSQNPDSWQSAKTVVEVFTSFLPQISAFSSVYVFIQRTIYVAASMLMNFSLMNNNYDTRCKIAGFLYSDKKLWLFSIGDVYFYFFQKKYNIVPISVNSNIFVERFGAENVYLSAKIIDMPLDIQEITNLADKKALLLATRNISSDKTFQTNVIEKNLSEKNIDSYFEKMQNKFEENATVCLFN